MKKKILYGIAVLIIAIVSVANVSFNNNSSKLSDISLANVEALAQKEDAFDYESMGWGVEPSDVCCF